ncbi:MAG: PAS domain S-box protein [Bacteroidales bacterium]|nr:PAS domain S-box protein [Bacteroidales bacterium]
MDKNDLGDEMISAGSNLEQRVKQLENELQTVKDAERQYREFYEEIPLSYQSLDEKGTIMDVNPAWEKMLGYEKQEVVGKPFSGLLHTGWVPAFEKAFRELKENGDTPEIDLRIQHKNGCYIHISMNGCAKYDQAGNFIATRCVFRDITERKKQELRIMEREVKYRTLMNNMPGMVYRGNLDWTIDIISNVESMCGYTKTDFITRKVNWMDILHPDDKERVLDEVLKIFDNGIPIVQQYRIIDAAGNERWISDHKAPVYDEEGNPRAIDGIVLEITERKEAEIRLRKNETFLRTLLDDIPIPVYYRDKEGRFQGVNKAFEVVLGVTEKELKGKTLFDLVPRKLAEIAHEKDQKMLHGRGWQQYEGQIVNSKGERRQVIFNKAIFHDENNRPVGIIGAALDITERRKSEQKLEKLNEELSSRNEEFQALNKALKQANNELVKAKEKAEESERLKSAFLANMSHEIRTPMNGILGFAELLKEPGLTGDEQEGYIEVIKKSGERMLNTINNLVNISRIEAGQMEFSPSSVNVNEQLDYLYTFFKPETEQKGIQLNVIKALKSKEAIIQTDHEKFSGILTNLLKNAVKYTHEGEISFGYEKKGSTLEFYVADTGIGIPPDRQEMIFDRFVQADLSISKPYEGTGLGLSIIKAYVEALDGKIWLKSQEDKGSTFYFTIPYHKITKETKKPDRDSAAKVSPPNPENLTLLIVEDEKSSEQYLTELLKAGNNQLLYAKTGLEALEICKAHPAIDIIMMDIKMPGMDGYEATRKIREFNKEVKIIAQTAYALEGDREKALEAGCDEYVSKPIKKEKLLDLLISMTSRNNDLSNEDALETEG